MTGERVLRVPSLANVAWPEGAVFVVDEALEPDLPRDALVPVPAGENLKTLAEIERLAERVLAVRNTRPLTLVAVGGGSITDAAGFLASILWRGVALWNVPTTLLGAADAAFGGKTAVNLGTRKNQLGTFWPAEVVVLVEEFLASLPTPQRAEGLAEITKTLWLSGSSLEVLDGGLDRLAHAPWDEVRAEIATLLDEAVATKAAITTDDPQETTGRRTLLNFGHTIAHAVERRIGIPHGRAVAWGLAAAAIVSRDYAGLDEEQEARLWRHVRPLLGSRIPWLSAAELADALTADKRRRHGRLNSVLLRAPGDAYVTSDVDARAWKRALDQAIVRARGPVAISLPAPTRCSLTVPASKSELARMLVIAELRPGETTVEGESNADDVVTLRASLRALRAGTSTIAAGVGAAPFRFLCAAAATRPGTTRIELPASLASRPHEPLAIALESLGVSVHRAQDFWEVGELPAVALRARVDVSRSSQYASGLALLAASGRVVTLVPVGDAVSSKYFELTLSLLEECGVRVERRDDHVALAPTSRLSDPLVLRAAPDASCLAVWRVARWLGLPVELDVPADVGRQPDAVIDTLWWDREANAEQVVDLRDTPDLAPVLVAAAALTPAPVRFVGAPHLRYKESDRIDALCSAFAAVGITVAPHRDGVSIGAGVQRPQGAGVFPVHGDHRLAMCACLLATAGELTIDDPTVVSKSYPEFWDHAMQAGFRLSDRSCPSPGT